MHRRIAATVPTATASDSKTPIPATSGSHRDRKKNSRSRLRKMIRSATRATPDENRSVIQPAIAAMATDAAIPSAADIASASRSGGRKKCAFE